MDYQLERFLKAQEHSYHSALREIKSGRKQSHWMWYIFPQLKHLGQSYNSQYYGIASLEEAQAYLEHPVLGNRLTAISTALLPWKAKKAQDIFGYIDTLKLCSSMTLFEIASNSDSNIFTELLLAFFDGRRDARTIQLLKNKE